jgi:hypothetical protein
MGSGVCGKESGTRIERIRTRESKRWKVMNSRGNKEQRAESRKQAKSKAG